MTILSKRFIIKNFFYNTYKNRQLVYLIAKRNIIGKYKGSFLGLFWSLANPVFMLSIYTFVFSVVFKTRWGVAVNDTAQFSFILFSGMIVFGLFSESILSSSLVIVENANYVKKVVFPLEILPIALIISALFHCIVSFAILVIGMTLFGTYPPLTALLTPLVILPLVIMTLGMSLTIASLGVYLRDIAQPISWIMSSLLFISPIFYPINAVPLEFQDLLLLNPLTIIIEDVRSLLIFGIVPEFMPLLKFYLASLVVIIAGIIFFEKSKTGFADVL